MNRKTKIFLVFMILSVSIFLLNTWSQETKFMLRSSEAADGGTLPAEFTGDGGGATLPLAWSSAPAETQSYVLIMHHIDPQGKTKWYWTLYNIPANVQNLPRNVQGVGTSGNNSINKRTEYAPPHSKGPGPKTYIYTVYALSSMLQLSEPPEQVNRDVLLSAMKGRILASAELRVVYSRTAGATGKGRDDDRDKEQREDKQKEKS